MTSAGVLRVGGSRERTYAAACATNKMVPLTRNGGVGVGLPPFPKASCGPLTLCPLTPCAGTGLLWATNGGRVVEIHRDWASIEWTPVIYEPPRSDRLPMGHNDLVADFAYAFFAAFHPRSANAVPFNRST